MNEIGRNKRFHCVKFNVFYTYSRKDRISHTRVKYSYRSYYI